MIGAKPNKVFNSLVQGTGLLSFSRLPIILDDKLSTTSLQCNIKSYTIPDINAEILFDVGPFGIVTAVPTSTQIDARQNMLQIEFILDEDMTNYNLLYRWLDVYKRLTYRSETNTKDGKHWDAKQAFCPFVDVAMFNNNKIIKNVIRFEQVFITNVGSIAQDFSSDDPVIFSCRFVYNQFKIISDPDNINEVIGDYI